MPTFKQIPERCSEDGRYLFQIHMFGNAVMLEVFAKDCSCESYSESSCGLPSKLRSFPRHSRLAPGIRPETLDCKGQFIFSDMSFSSLRWGSEQNLRMLITRNFKYCGLSGFCFDPLSPGPMRKKIDLVSRPLDLSYCKLSSMFYYSGLGNQSM